MILSDKNMGVYSSRTKPQSHEIPGNRPPAIDRSTWKRVRLGEISSLKRGVRVVRNQLSEGKFLVYQNSMTPLGHYDFANTSADTTFVIAAGSAGEIGYSEHPFWAADDCFYFIPSCLTTSKYLYYALLANRDAISAMVRHGSIPRLSKDLLLKLPLLLPNEDIQHEIIASLFAIDSHISSLRSLITKYEAIKKATVNLLLRPKEGWRRIRLGEVCSSFQYGINAPSKPFDGLSKYIRITDIDNRTRRFVPNPLVSPAFYDAMYSVDIGDILLARTGASVGKAYLYDENDGNLLFAGFLIRAKIDMSIASPIFVFMQTLTQNYWKWVEETSMRSGQPGINAEQFAEFKFFLPPLSEQRRIAARLSAIDECIKNCRAKLEKAQSIKQGMMAYFFG